MKNKRKIKHNLNRKQDKRLGKRKEILLNRELLKSIYYEFGMIKGAKHIGIGIQTMRRWLDKQEIERKGKIKYEGGIRNPNRLTYFISGGYMCINKRSWKKEIRLHKYLMEKHLKRKLKKTEHVHHIDGNKLNNDLKNLIVIPNTEHLKIENQIKQLAFKLYKKGIIKWDFNKKKYYLK